MSRLLRQLVAIAAIAASVGLSHPATAARAPAPRLFLVADSVALGAAPAIRAAFAGWDVAIQGHQGIFTDDAAEVVWANRAEVAPIAVVATGYNYPVWNPALFDGWIDQMMRRLVDAGAQHVFWLTLREPPLGDHDIVSVWEKSGIANHYPQANEQLRAATDRWPQLAMADWNGASRGPGLTWDGLHVTPAGGAVMADLLVDEVGGIGRLPAGGTLRLTVPPGAGAAAINLTATWPRGAGYLTAWPCDQPRPLASFTFAPGQLVVDVAGWFDAGSALRAANPTRLADTRTTGARLQPGGVLAVAAPGGAGAVVVTATAVDPSGPGYLTVYPCGPPPPAASTLNYQVNGVVANLAVAAAGTGGQVCVTSFAAADVVVDLAAWVPPGAAFQPAGPRRLADTGTA